MPVKRNVQIVTKYKQVPDGKIETVSFETDDGRSFTNETDASEHQIQLDADRLWNEIPVKHYSDNIPSQLPEEYYCAKTEEELDAIKYAFGYNDNYDYLYIDDNKIDNKTIPYMITGTWYGHIFWDGGDRRGVNYIYSLNYIKTSLLEYLKNLGE